MGFNVSNMQNRCLLVITGAFNLGGGIATANRLVIYALVDAGYQVDVFSLNEFANAMSDNPELSKVDYTSFANHKIPFALAVWRALLTRKYDFVFCDHVNLAWILLPFGKLGRISVFVMLHGVECFLANPDREGQARLVSRIALDSDFRLYESPVMRQFPHLRSPRAILP